MSADTASVVSLWSSATTNWGAGLRQRVTLLRLGLAARLGRVSTERWWLLLFVVLFLAFFVALLFQPGIGRGGR